MESLLLTDFRTYGWLAVAVFFLIREVWPWLSKMLSKKQEIKMNQTLAALDDEREQRKAERIFRHEMDERQLKAYEKLADAAQTTAQLLTTMNERINQIETGQARLTSYLTESVTSMRETVAKLHNPPTGRKSRKVEDPTPTQGE